MPPYYFLWWFPCLSWKIVWIWNILLGMNKTIWIWPLFAYWYKLIFQEIGSVLLSSHLCPLPMFWNSETTSTFLPLQKLFLPSWWPKCDSRPHPQFVSLALKQEIIIKTSWGLCHTGGRYSLCDSNSLLGRLSLLLLRGVWQPSSSSIIHAKEIEFTLCSFLPAHHPHAQAYS